MAVAANIKPYMSSHPEDSSIEYAPCKVDMKKGKRTVIYLDPFPLTLKRDMPKKGTETVQQSYWTIWKLGGLDRYRDMSEEISETPW